MTGVWLEIQAFLFEIECCFLSWHEVILARKLPMACITSVETIASQVIPCVSDSLTPANRSYSEITCDNLGVVFSKSNVPNIVYISANTLILIGYKNYVRFHHLSLPENMWLWFLVDSYFKVTCSLYSVGC